MASGPLRHDGGQANREGRCEVRRLRGFPRPIMNVGALSSKGANDVGIYGQPKWTSVGGRVATLICYCGMPSLTRHENIGAHRAPESRLEVVDHYNKGRVSAQQAGQNCPHAALYLAGETTRPAH